LPCRLCASARDHVNSGMVAKKKHSKSESFVYWAEYKCLRVIHI